MGSVSGYNPYSSYINPPSPGTAVSGGSAQEQGAIFPSSSPPAEQPKKSGGIGGFFKGIIKGVVHTVKSLCTPKGLLMAAAGVAACVAFPVAGPLLLGGAAVLSGGSKVVKGLASGDTEAAGEGFLTAGLGAVGIKASGALSAGKVAGAADEATAATSADDAAAASKGGFLSKLNPFKSSKPAAADEATATTTASESTAVAAAPSKTPLADGLTSGQPKMVEVPTGAFIKRADGVMIQETKMVPADAAVATEAASSTVKPSSLFQRAKADLSLADAKARLGQGVTDWKSADGAIAKIKTLPLATTPAVLSTAAPSDQ